MKFKILVLSDTLERSRRLLGQFVIRENVDYSQYPHSDPLLETQRFGKLTLRDGTLMVARSVSQHLDRFKALQFDQVFYDVDLETIPTELIAHIELELMRSPIPHEFQWTRLCPDYLMCFKCTCCKQHRMFRS